MSLDGRSPARPDRRRRFYEGYVLYPYRASARKEPDCDGNSGCSVPDPLAASGQSGEASTDAAPQMIVEAGDADPCSRGVRVLQVQAQDEECLDTDGRLPAGGDAGHPCDRSGPASTRRSSTSGHPRLGLENLVERRPRHGRRS